MTYKVVQSLAWGGMRAILYTIWGGEGGYWSVRLAFVVHPYTHALSLSLSCDGDGKADSSHSIYCSATRVIFVLSLKRMLPLYPFPLKCTSSEAASHRIVTPSASELTMFSRLLMAQIL